MATSNQSSKNFFWVAPDTALDKLPKSNSTIFEISERLLLMSLEVFLRADCGFILNIMIMKMDTF